MYIICLDLSVGELLPASGMRAVGQLLPFGNEHLEN